MLTEIRDTGKRTNCGKVIALFECDCGNLIESRRTHVKQGLTKSCGCHRIQVAARMGKLNTTHGHRSDGMESPEHISWRAMKSRCLDPNHSNFKRYGEKGIMICERWMAFENFLADMGPRPDGFTISRADHNKNYEPGNCTWERMGMH